jgi:ribosomal protein L11 methyltransferase
MDNYYELTIIAGEEDLRSILIARLSAIGYDGFEETETALKAYIQEEDFNEELINNLFSQYSLSYSKSVVKKQNWNRLWESNFEPVQVDDFVGVRAAFHPPFANLEHEIIITPKMSFGTGHHATTWLVMQLMREVDFKGKTVFDFGTGTGILAILAAKLGATRVRAVDNDDWCVENASENILVNSCDNIDIEKVSVVESNETYHIILANINRNIILDNIGVMVNILVPGGDLILSGLLVSDETDILAACATMRLVHRATVEKNGWIAIRLYRNS